MTQIPAGWYPDPAPQSVPGRQRYWDGQRWTEHLHDPQPVTPPPPPAYPAYPGTPDQGYPQAQPQAQPQAMPQAYPSAYPSAPAYHPEAARPATTPDGVPLAGWWWRVLARVLDGFIGLPLYALAITPVVASQWSQLQRWVDDLAYAADHNTPDPPAPDLFDITTGPGFLLLLSGLAAYLVYEVVFLLWKQATPGKLIVGLRVRRREDPGLPVGAVLGRVGFVLLGQFCGLLLLLDYLWPLWDANKQALHDKVARTNVVRPGDAGKTPVATYPDAYPATDATEAGLPRRW
jgi:uncharacterized RDD family membrane protein YckC